MNRQLIKLSVLSFVAGYSCIASAKPPRFGICHPVVSVDINTRRAESLGVVGAVFDLRNIKNMRQPEPTSDTKVELLVPPRHGEYRVKEATSPSEWPDYQYLGDKGYTGEDTFTVKVHLREGPVEATYFTKVVVGDSAAVSHCKKHFGRDTWRIR